MKPDLIYEYQRFVCKSTWDSVPKKGPKNYYDCFSLDNMSCKDIGSLLIANAAMRFCAVFFIVVDYYTV